MGRVIGIDLGTFNSCVAVMEREGPLVLTARSGLTTTPSVVAISANGRRLVGQIAKRQIVTNAENTVYAAKRLIGRRFDSPQVQLLRENAPYRIVEGPHGDPRIELRERTYSIPELSAMVLAEMRMIAEDYLGEQVSQAVVTVPAYFNDGQRQATKDAGAIAGLEILRIINEPTAAALAHGFDKKIDRTIAVYDLGGGTFDVSILELSGSGVFKVIATSGDTFLGGEDFDQRIIDWLVDGFREETGVDLRNDRIALQRLKDAAEKAKTELSSSLETEIKLPFLIGDASGEALHLERKLTRTTLEKMTVDLIDRTLALCELTLEEAGLDKDEIEEVLLVGGMTRMPLVQAAVGAFFERTPNSEVNPDEVVAVGAAIQGAAMVDQSHDMVLLDVTPHTLGVVIAGGYVEELILQNSTVPVQRSKVFTTTRDAQTAVKIIAVQGESRRADENELLGEFTLQGLRRAPAGHVSVEVTFEIDMDGIVIVRAKDLETQLEHSITVTSTSGLTADEVQSMMSDAHQYAVTSRASEEVESARAEAQTLIAAIEALLPSVEASTAGNAFAREAVDKGLAVIEKARGVVAQGDVEAIKEQVGALGRTKRLFEGVAGT